MLKKQRGNRTIGRPQFMSSIADFTNPLKNRRMIGNPSSDSKEGAAGAGGHGAGSGGN